MKAELSTTVRSERIDRESGVIFGVSVITEGLAKTHDKVIDAKTLRTVKESAESYPGGLKVKMEHGTDAKDIVGVLKGFRIDGSQLKADLHLLKNSQWFSQVVEMAETIPDLFGLSISFSCEIEEVGGLKCARCVEIYSADIVDTPAANVNGLFSIDTEVDTKNKHMNKEATPEGEKTSFAEKLVTDLSARLETFASRINELETLISGVAFKEELKQLVTKEELKPFASTEALEALRTEMVSTDILAQRKLAAMGVPASNAPAVETQATKEGLLEQFNKITDVAKRREFLRQHQSEIWSQS
jgi:hypothetical protein